MPPLPLLWKLFYREKARYPYAKDNPCQKGSFMMQTAISHIYWTQNSRCLRHPKHFREALLLNCPCEDYTSAPKHVFPGNSKPSHLIIPVDSVANSDSYLKHCWNQVLKLGRHLWNLTARFSCRKLRIVLILSSYRSFQYKYIHLNYSRYLIAHVRFFSRGCLTLAWLTWKALCPRLHGIGASGYDSCYLTLAI